MQDYEDIGIKKGKYETEIHIPNEKERVEKEFAMFKYLASMPGFNVWDISVEYELAKDTRMDTYRFTFYYKNLGGKYDEKYYVKYDPTLVIFGYHETDLPKSIEYPILETIRET